MDKRDRHGAVPNRRRHALDRAMTDIARDEHPWVARLKQHRLALERPAGQAIALLQVRPGNDVAVSVAAGATAWPPT